MEKLTLLLAAMAMLTAITASSCTLRGDFYGGQKWHASPEPESRESPISAWKCENDLPFNCDDGL